MNSKGQTYIAAVAIAVLVFLIVLSVWGQVYASLNMAVFSSGVQNLLNLIPLVLVGSAIVGTVVVAFRMAG